MAEAFVFSGLKRRETMNRDNQLSERELLLRRYAILEDGKPSDSYRYYAAYLFSQFGAVVDKPEKLSDETFKAFCRFFCVCVPPSWLANPQDLKFYSSDEVIAEQILSYFLAYGEDDSHIKLFDKELPEYVPGTDIKIREYKVVDDTLADEILDRSMDAYQAYSRPWSQDEEDEIYSMIGLGHMFHGAPKCKDNVCSLILSGIHDYDSALSLKDLIKLSTAMVGPNRKELRFDLQQKNTLMKVWLAIDHYDSNLSKKQSKYVRAILKNIGVGDWDDEQLRKDAVDRKIVRILKRGGDPVEAAEICAKSGSKLQRHLVWILSRCKTEEQRDAVLEKVRSSNPIALIQLLSKKSWGKAPRQFSFKGQDKLTHIHCETEDEAAKRKSILSEEASKELEAALHAKALAGFASFKRIGKAYMTLAFDKIALPINTSSSGKGIDCVPSGSRLPIGKDKIRTFVWWKDACDIDSTLTLVKQTGDILKTTYVNFSNFAWELERDLRGAVWFSGDVTSRNGSEYFDLDLNELKARGYTYVVQSFHGYCDALDVGEIKAGYQEKTDLMTTAWDPKDIAFQMHVCGKTRACLAFAIDVDSNEIVVLNDMVSDESRVISGRTQSAALSKISAKTLPFSMADVIRMRADIVDDPKDADVVFSEESVELKDGQRQVRPSDVEQLAKLLANVEF